MLLILKTFRNPLEGQKDRVKSINASSDPQGRLGLSRTGPLVFLGVSLGVEWRYYYLGNAVVKMNWAHNEKCSAEDVAYASSLSGAVIMWLSHYAWGSALYT